MYPSVAAAFWSSVAGAEGVTPWAYPDDKGLISAAMGMLYDDGNGQVPASFIALPWQIEAPGLGARKATSAEISAAWHKIKDYVNAHPESAKLGGGNSLWQNMTDIRLGQDAIHQATNDWLRQREPILKKYFPGYDTAPADAQLALLGMSYAMGPAFAPGWPAFTHAMNAVPPNYTEAAAQSQITKDVNSAIDEHNATNYQLLLNAAAAMHSRTPFSALWWPANVDPGTGVAASSPPPSVAIMGLAGHLGVGGFFGRAAVAMAVVTLGMLGVSTGVAVARGQPWQTPFRRIGRAGAAFGRRMDQRLGVGSPPKKAG